MSDFDDISDWRLNMALDILEKSRPHPIYKRCPVCDCYKIVKNGKFSKHGMKPLWFRFRTCSGSGVPFVEKK